MEFVKEPVFYTPEEKRIAGISAFAFNGTNVHVVVENQLPQETKSNWNTSQEYVLKISAKEESALELYLQEIYKTLRDTREDFMDCVATLNLGRDDFACRGAVTFRTKEECLQKLCSCAVHRCPKHGGVALCGENAKAMTARLANCGVVLVKPERGTASRFVLLQRRRSELEAIFRRRFVPSGFPAVRQHDKEAVLA